jgi:hypothetical protein
MFLLAIKILSIWTLAAMAAGFCLGAVIRKAERDHKEEFLDALFSTLAGQRIAR